MHSKFPIFIALVLGALSCNAAAQPSAEKSKMLLIGAPHFANHGADVINTKVVSVLTPERQREIQEIVTSLISFKPTRVIIEWPIKKQDILDQRYTDYRAGKYVLTAGESEQIGFRLAAEMGHDRIYAVDWNEMPPGEIADLDYVAYAKQHDLIDLYNARRAQRQKQSDSIAKWMNCTPISAWLRYHNTPQYRRDAMQVYYDYTEYGDALVNPGANWVGNWYTRNLKIHANITRIANRTNERLVVIYGAGHAYWLEHFARGSGQFDMVDPLNYLANGQPYKHADCPQ